MSLQITTDKEPTHTTNSNLNQKLTDKSKHMPQSPFLIYMLKKQSSKLLFRAIRANHKQMGKDEKDKERNEKSRTSKKNW
jgi:hypothetical protein